MFDKLINCKIEELLTNTVNLFESIDSKDKAETVIRILWGRISEMTDEQEKELHKIGRKIRKKFNMKPIKM